MKKPQKKKMTHAEHIQRHKILHHFLDELAADYFEVTGKLLSESSIMDLMKWNYTQTINPDLPKGQSYDGL